MKDINLKYYPTIKYLEDSIGNYISLLTNKNSFYEGKMIDFIDKQMIVLDNDICVKKDDIKLIISENIN